MAGTETGLLCHLSPEQLQKKRKQLSEKNELEPRQKKKKDHTGDMESMSWDKVGLKREVEGYEDNQIFSWRDLAIRYNVCNKAGEVAKNGGQIVKEWLLSQKVDLARFSEKQKCSSVPITRKQKRRGPGGDITLPVEIHPEAPKQKLAEKLRSGEYSIGEIIVPKKVQNYILY